MDYDSKDNMKEIIPVIVQRYCCPIGLAYLLLILAKGVNRDNVPKGSWFMAS